MRRALAHQIGSPENSLRACWLIVRLRRQSFVRSRPSSAPAGQNCRETSAAKAPPPASPPSQTSVPGIAWQNVCSRPCGIQRRTIRRREHDSRSTDRRAHHSRAHNPHSHRARRLIARACNYRRASFQSRCGRALLRNSPANFWRFISTRQHGHGSIPARRATSADHSRRATSSSNVPEASATSIARVTRQPEPHVILRQHHLAARVPSFSARSRAPTAIL